MSNRHAFLFGALVVILAGATPFGGQQPPVTPPPAGTPEAAAPQRGRGGRGGGAVRSGEVAADGRVTFRLRAPNAQAVAVAMAGNRRFEMKKDEQGVWSVTTDPLKPDYYTYSLVVDGDTINDPGNRTVQTGFGNFQSMVFVPGPDPWLPSDVPHGAIARHRFKSAIANDDRDFFAYTPPGYNPRRARAYPLL